ncbi:uncharacterized protein BJX67DRAFT_308008 [Aspergillus lucknowensis]|uniref:Uncharacterized protein n=1 Tax=Aspergillus lucknowensis TaxID=176173 RepID=A0ABR4M183_9EURO
MSRAKHPTPDSESHPQHTCSPGAQTFPLAHPPPKSKSKSHRQCLRLSSRLLLQIQQLYFSTTHASTLNGNSNSNSNTNGIANESTNGFKNANANTNVVPRSVPILELYQPSTFGKSVASAAGIASRKAHSRDMYLVQSEPFAHLPRKAGEVNVNGTKARSGSRSGTNSRAQSRRKSKSSHESSGEDNEEGRERKIRFKKRVKDTNRDDDEEEEDVVAVIYTSPTKAKSKPTKNATATATDSPPEAQLYFPLSGATWDATSPAPGRYRFRQDLEGNGLGAEGVGVVFEWEKRPASPASSSSPSPTSTGETQDDGDRFVLGVAGPSAKRPWLAQLTRRGLHVGGLDTWRGELRALMIDDGAEGGAGLYTLLVTMGVWVARREGWIH